MRILMVCLGNICRSPTAEAVLRAKAAKRGLDWTFDSAGTAGWYRETPPYAPMIEVAGAAGYDLTPLRSRQITPEDFGRFDLILVADQQNQSDVETVRPKGSTTPVRFLAPCGEWFAGRARPLLYMGFRRSAALD